MYELSSGGTACTIITYYYNAKTYHRAEYATDTRTLADACIIGQWSRILVTYNKILVGYYKLDSEISEHNVYSDMFSLAPKSQTNVMPNEHTLLIGKLIHTLYIYI